MTKGISLVQLQRLLAVEGGWAREHAVAPTAQNPNQSRINLLEHVRGGGRSGNLVLTVATEKSIVEDELINHANSKGMISSLNAAPKELTVIEKLLAIVDDEAKYEHVDQSHILPRNRENGLPLDEARQAFKSHHALLSNLDSARLSEEEKKIIDARKSNIFLAGKLYAERQAKTLGVDLGQTLQ